MLPKQVEDRVDYRDAAMYHDHVPIEGEKDMPCWRENEHNKVATASLRPWLYLSSGSRLEEHDHLFSSWKSLHSAKARFLILILVVAIFQYFYYYIPSYFSISNMRLSGLVSAAFLQGLLSSTVSEATNMSTNRAVLNADMVGSDTSMSPYHGDSWHKYVRSPPEPVVKAKAIVYGSIVNNVTNAQGMVVRGHGVMTLERTSINAPVPSVILDFGLNVVGYLSISFAAASNNTPGVRLAFSETLQYLSDVCDFSRSDHERQNNNRPGSDQIAVSPTRHVWTDEYACKANGKVCSDGLHGFRYVKISLDALAADSPLTSPYGFVSIDSVSVNISAFIGTPNTFNGWFECSDKELNQYWYDGAYTNDMTTDVFGKNDTEIRQAYSKTLEGKLVLHDGAKRDRDPYMGDLAVGARTAYVTHKENSIAAYNVMADLADHQRADGWIPPASILDYTLGLFDYPLWWVACSYDYLMYTNNVSYAKKYYPTLLKVLDKYYENHFDSGTGLLLRRSDTSEPGDYAFISRSGFVTYFNALYVIALRNAASIATIYGNPSDAARWSARAKVVSAGVNKYLWDNSAGAYLDSLGRSTHSQDGNMLSILAGIATPEMSTRILNYWTSLAKPWGNPFYSDDSLDSSYSTRVYAFISYFELQARIQHENPSIRNSAIEEIKRLYGWMSSRDPWTTFWEGIGDGGEPYEGSFTSMAHGWSTGVTPLLTNHILGIQALTPGFGEWIVKPRTVDAVSWARGQVDTPHGVVRVDWRKGSDSNSFVIILMAPTGTKGTVCLPVGREATVSINGKILWLNSRSVLSDASEYDEKDGICTSVEGGTWTFSAS